MGGRIIARTEFDEDYDNTKYSLKEFSKSLTDQSGVAAADIRNIVNRHIKSGVPFQGVNWGETNFVGCDDYMSAMNKIADADEAFEALPSKVRKRFANDPARLLEFVSNADNYDEALKLGLVRKREPVQMDNQIPSTEPKKDPQ